MLGMEGEPCVYVQKWLCQHRDAFDAHGPNDEKLFTTEWSSDSWTIETPSGTSSTSSSAGGKGPPGGELGLLGVDSLGGGDWEEAPNNWAGGSYPVASMQKIRPGGVPITKLQLLRSVQANLAEYVNEEIGHGDVTNGEQGWYSGVLSQAVLHKVEAEEQLLQNHQDQVQACNKEMEEEFLVTKTVSTKEVMDDFENWVPAIQAEYTQLVQTKEAVQQITKKALQAKAENPID